jgi:hypothetical protein
MNSQLGQEKPPAWAGEQFGVRHRSRDTSHLVIALPFREVVSDTELAFVNFKISARSVVYITLPL